MNAFVDPHLQSGVKGVKPFVKWVGGKRSLLPELTRHMPDAFNRYYEPFVGGGALFWDMLSKQNRLSGYHINDANADLTACYRAVRNDVEGLIRTLATEDFRNDRDCFEAWRAMDRQPDFAEIPDVLRAARFIYLNRTCFNGLSRYNRNGEFNASFGKYAQPFVPDVVTLRRCSQALNEAEVTISTGCFSKVIDSVQAGDFVYLDPPYAPLSATADFTSYTSEKFDAVMQFKLRDICDELTERGAFVMQSNSSAEFVYALYDGYEITEIEAPRKVSCKAGTRNNVKEVLIKNY